MAETKDNLAQSLEAKLSFWEGNLRSNLKHAEAQGYQSRSIETQLRLIAAVRDAIQELSE